MKTAPKIDLDIIVPQNDCSVETVVTPKDDQISVWVQIEGDFPPVTKALAQKYMAEVGDVDDTDTDEDEDEDEGLYRPSESMVVADHIVEQLVTWHEINGTWLSIGDEVEHLDPERGMFRIVGRMFCLEPLRISFTVKYREID